MFRGEVVYLTDTHSAAPHPRADLPATTTRFQNDDAVRFNATDTFDRVDSAVRDRARRDGVRAGDYHFVDMWGEGETSGKRTWSARLRAGGGDFYGGTRVRSADARPGGRRRRLSFEAAYEFNDVDLPQGAFTTHVVNARMNVNLSNRWLTTTLPSTTARRSGTSLYVRLNYIYRPGDDLFVVFNQSAAGEASG